MLKIYQGSFAFKIIETDDVTLIDNIKRYSFYSSINNSKSIFKISNAYYYIVEEQINKLSLKPEIIFSDEFKDIKIFEHTNIKLYDFQKEAVSKLINNDLFILGDEVGLGKTITSLFALKNLEHENTKFLIVSPLSLIDMWKTNLKIFNLENKTKIINYEKINADFDYSVNYDVVIFDEASRLRNNTLFRTNALLIKFKKVWLLSAIPIERNPKDIYNIITTFNKKYFFYNSFFKTFPIYENVYTPKGLINKIVGWKNLDILNKQLKPIYISRTRNDLLIDSGKLEVIKEILSPTKYMITEMDKIRHNMDNVLTLFGKLRLIIDGLDVNYNLIDMSKVELIKKYSNESKILIFTSYNLVAKELAKYLDNSLKVSGDNSLKERTEILNKFKNDKNIKYLITTDIFKYGQNISNADVIIHYDLPLTYATLTQREGRNNRIDNIKEKRKIVYILTKTYIDNRVYEIITTKKNLNEYVMKECLAKIGEIYEHRQ